MRKSRTSPDGPVRGETQEADLGAAAPQAVRYDLEVYGFDRSKLRFASTNRTSLVVGDGVVPPMLPQARERNAARAAMNKGHEFDSHENRPLGERCLLMNQVRIPMTPGANEGNLLQIVQGQICDPAPRDGPFHTRHPHRRPPARPQNIRQWQATQSIEWEYAGRRHDQLHQPDGYRAPVKNASGRTLTRTADDTMITGLPSRSRDVGQALDSRGSLDENERARVRVRLPRRQHDDLDHPSRGPRRRRHGAEKSEMNVSERGSA